MLTFDTRNIEWTHSKSDPHDVYEGVMYLRKNEITNRRGLDPQSASYPYVPAIAIRGEERTLEFKYMSHVTTNVYYKCKPDSKTKYYIRVKIR